MLLTYFALICWRKYLQKKSIESARKIPEPTINPAVLCPPTYI